MSVTATLLLSLIQDIHILNALLENVTKTHKTCTLKSWLFPSKPHEIVSKIIDDKSFKRASYEQILEVTLDRLYVLVNFFLQYIQNSEEVPKNALIARPPKSTLGLCLQLLWGSIEKLMEKKTMVQTELISGNSFIVDHKQTQTEIISLNACDSCSSVFLFMKRLLQSFDNQHDQIKINYKIFDITQFGCMLKVTSSIEHALNDLYTRLHQVKVEKDELQSQNEDLKIRLHEKNARIAFLEEELNILRRQLEKGSHDIWELRQAQNKSIEDIDSKRSRINNLIQTIESLQISLEAITEQNNIRNYECSLLKSNVVKSTQLLSICNTKINEKIRKLDSEYNIIKSIIDQYEKSVTCLNIKLVKITKNVGKTEMKLKTSFEGTKRVFENFSKYDTFCVNIKDIFKQKINNIKNQPEVISIKGNPVKDIAKQIEDNKKKIENLEDENIRLEKLLDRFKNVKLTNN